MFNLFPLTRFVEDDNISLLSLEEAEHYVKEQKSDAFLLKILKTKNNYNYDNPEEILECLISIFDDAIDQIHMLSGGKDAENAISDFNCTLEERVAKAFIDDPVFDMESGEPYSLAFERHKVRKVIMDGSTIKEFLILIRNELRDDNSYRSVRSITKRINFKKEEENALLQEAAHNFERLKSFRNILINIKDDIQKDVQKVHNDYAKAKDNSELLTFLNVARTKYIGEWERARREQNIILCERTEERLQHKVDKCKYETRKETRINSEIVQFLLNREQKLQIQIKEWTNKFSTDTEKRNIQYQLLREARDNYITKTIETVKLYETHKKEIEYFENLMEMRNAERILKTRRRQAAVKIQRWWRQEMIRLKLGRYSKKRRRGRKGKKKVK